MLSQFCEVLNPHSFRKSPLNAERCCQLRRQQRVESDGLTECRDRTGAWIELGQAFIRSLGSDRIEEVPQHRRWVVVDRSTTGANPAEWVETGWTEPQARGLARTVWTESATLPR